MCLQILCEMYITCWQLQHDDSDNFGNTIAWIWYRPTWNAYYVSYSVSRGSLPRVKQTEREANHSPHLVPKLRMSGVITAIPFIFLGGGELRAKTLTFIFLRISRNMRKSKTLISRNMNKTVICSLRQTNWLDYRKSRVITYCITGPVNRGSVNITRTHVVGYLYVPLRKVFDV